VGKGRERKERGREVAEGRIGEGKGKGSEREGPSEPCYATGFIICKCKLGTVMIIVICVQLTQMKFYSVTRVIGGVDCVQEKPFRCPLCERCFGQQTNLDRHLKKHESDGPNVLDSPPPELDLDLTSSAQSPAAADTQRDAYFNEIRKFIGQACGSGNYVTGAPPLVPNRAPNRWFLQQAGRYSVSSAEGRERGRSPCDLEEDELDWEDGEATAPRSTGQPQHNGSWPGAQRLMAALGGAPTGGSSSGGRTMLHNLLAMTSGDRAYPSTAVSPPAKSPARPSSNALKTTSNIAPPCVF